MEITCQLIADDFWSFDRFVFKRVPALKRKIILNLISPIVVWLGIFWVFRFPLPVCILLNLALWICWPFYYFPELKRQAIKRAEMTPNALSQQILTINSNELRLRNSMSEATTIWNNFTELVEDNQHFFFFISERFALVVPKRAFSAPEQAQAFLETARAYHRSALEGAVPILPAMDQIWPPAPQRIVS